MFISLFATLVASVASIGAYLAWLNHDAAKLVNAAYEIRTKSDADRTIDNWKKRHGKDFWQEHDQAGGDHVYDAVIDNVALARLRVVEPTAFTVSITYRTGQLWSVFVSERSGWQLTGAVSITEWFDDTMPKRVAVFGNRRPYAAAVEFSAFIPEEQRRLAFGFNSRCLVSIHACNREGKLLPAISRLDLAPASLSAR